MTITAGPHTAQPKIRGDNSQKEKGRLLSQKSCILYFSVGVALLWTISFYPGILYSDSVPRWQLAIEVAKNGFTHVAFFGSHHPVIPSFMQAPFYSLTNEVGFYIFCQATAFCLALFYFVRTFTKSSTSQIITGLVILSPINHIYAIFHSFDSVFAISFIALSASLIRLKLTLGKRRYWLLSLAFFFLCVSSRLNAILLIFPIALYTSPLLRPFSRKKLLTITITTLWILSATTPVLIPGILQMKGGNSWAIGFSWEYANLASKSTNEKHQEFLGKIGASTEKISENICYNGIWCGHEHREVISKVQGSSERSKEVFKNYLDIAINEPALFWGEKAKYLNSLLGISRPIENFEIAKWRSGNWEDEFHQFDFHTAQSKENIIDNYFAFSKTHNYLFKPYLIFLLLIVVIVLPLFLKNSPKYKDLSAAAAFSILYYATFFVTAQNHEFRYFYPSLLLAVGILIAFTGIIIQKNLSRKVIISVAGGIVITLWCANTFRIYNKNKEIEELFHNHQILELTESMSAVYTAKNSIVYRSKNCQLNIKHRFFLHTKLIQKSAHNTRKNLDFYWKDNAIEESAFIENCYAEIPLNQDELISFGTGQFEANNNRTWAVEITPEDIEIKVPYKIQPVELTDGNWENGLSKKQAGFFILNTPQNRKLTHGTEILLPNSEKRKITNIHMTEKYINIDISGKKVPASAGSPNWIQVLTQ